MFVFVVRVGWLFSVDAYSVLRVDCKFVLGVRYGLMVAVCRCLMCAVLSFFGWLVFVVYRSSLGDCCSLLRVAWC